MIDVSTLVQLALEVDKGDPTYWDHLAIDEATAYTMIATKVLEQFSNINTNDGQVVALATVTKLMVDNFVLNLKLLKQNE